LHASATTCYALNLVPSLKEYSKRINKKIRKFGNKTLQKTNSRKDKLLDLNLLEKKYKSLISQITILLKVFLISFTIENFGFLTPISK